MADLEKKLSELAHELLQKKVDFEKMQQSCNSELVKTQEQKMQIEMMQTEMENMSTQLEMTKKALHRCEESSSSFKEASVKYKLSLEALAKTTETTKDLANKLQLENAKLKKQAEELKREMKSESYFQQSCTSKQAKIKAAIEAIAIQIRSSEKDFRNVDRKADEVISIVEKGKAIQGHKNDTIAKLSAKSEELSKHLISLTSENRILRENIEKMKVKIPEEQHYVREILQEWQTAVNEANARSSSIEKDLATHSQALQNALVTQANLQKLGSAASERVRELEAQLEEAKNGFKKNCTDCSAQTDLNISIDMACETMRLETTDTATQTDTAVQDTITETTKPRQEYISQAEQISSDAVSAYISRLQKDMDIPNLQHQLISDMSTQINNNIPR